MKRAEIGIHTNSAFARLLTDSIMVKIETTAERGSPRWRIAARHAGMVAYNRLQESLSDRSFSFFFAPSHPNYRAEDQGPAEAETSLNEVRAKPAGTESGLVAEDPTGEQISSQRAA